ncbi:MAG: protease complex subunit PrcB family protein [Clostridia bacterium]
MEFRSISIFQAPSQVERMVQQQSKEEGAAVYVAGDAVYIVVARGEKPTGGYGIRVVDIKEEGGGFDVHVEYLDPKPGQMVAQVVTHPYAIIKADLKDISQDTSFRFFVDGNRNWVHTARYLEG